ncbi:MAG: THUMP domain-containing protein [Saprospiraceae bacterium]|nr:THUMP domain-containing protein [Saprospiraceae bacterium]
MNLVAKTFAGLEEVLADELRAIEGVTEVEITKRGVLFEGDKRVLYRANLECRTALRFLLPIHYFKSSNEQSFYRKIQDIDWWEIMDIDQTFAVDAVVRSSIFRHSHYIGLKTKDAIVDQFRDRLDKRPSINTEQPDIRINVHIHEDEVIVSLDASGESLHRRGYRQQAVEAPLNEVLAAGMIKLSGWTGETDFTDAMCGGGTLLTEAALIAANRHPQYRRTHFCFKQWQDFDKALFDDILSTYAAQEVDFSCVISGSDFDGRAVRISEKNIEAIGFADKIHVQRGDFFNRKPPEIKEGSILMMNPPYDERLELDDAIKYYKTIGDSLKHNWKGCTAWVFTGNLEAAKFIGLRPRRKIHLFNGALECRLLKFELY